MISTVLFDMNDVLCRYDRAGPRRPSGAKRAASRLVRRGRDLGSGYEDLGDPGAMEAEAYLAGFAERLGGGLTLDAWIDIAARRGRAAAKRRSSLRPRSGGALRSQF